MKLCRNEALLAPHEVCIILPDLPEGLFACLVEREDVHEHDGGGIDIALTFYRKSRIHWAQ